MLISIRFWRFHLRRKHKYVLWCSDRIDAEEEVVDCEGGLEDGTVHALVRDPSLQGDKELYLLYEKEFQDILKGLREDDERCFCLAKRP